MHVNAKYVTYFDSLGVEHIPREIKKIIENKNNSTMCGYFCVGFIDFMLKRKNLSEHINLFFPNEYKKNNKVTRNYFQ